MKRATWGAVALLSLALIAGCSSSGGSAKSSSPPPSTPPPSTRVSSTPVSTPPPPTSSAPLSPYEANPAVRAMRAWAAEAARTVNTGKFDSPALDQVMTPTFAKGMKIVLGGDVGLEYPGPIPLQPLGIVSVSATERQIKICDVDQGFALNKTTKKPAHAYNVSPANAYLVLVKGRWLMDNLSLATGFSCSAVKVAKPTW